MLPKQVKSDFVCFWNAKKMVTNSYLPDKATSPFSENDPEIGVNRIPAIDQFAKVRIIFALERVLFVRRSRTHIPSADRGAALQTGKFRTCLCKNYENLFF